MISCFNSKLLLKCKAIILRQRTNYLPYIIFEFFKRNIINSAYLYFFREECFLLIKKCSSQSTRLDIIFCFQLHLIYFFRFCNGDIKSWIYLHFWYSFPTLELFISKRMYFFTFLLLYSVAMLSFSESGVVENCHVPPALTRCNKKVFFKIAFRQKVCTRSVSSNKLQ